MDQLSFASLDNASRVVDRDAIMATVWPDVGDSGTSRRAT